MSRSVGKGFTFFCGNVGNVYVVPVCDLNYMASDGDKDKFLIFFTNF